MWIKIIFSCVLLVFSYSSRANLWYEWKTDYKENSQIVGTWKGKVFNKSFEFSVWPRQGHSDLIGVMIWGSCEAIIEVGGSSFKHKKTGKTIVRYGLRSWVNREEFLNNQCPERSRNFPGALGFSLRTDNKHYRVLTIHTPRKHQLIGHKKHTHPVIRTTPSREMIGIIDRLEDRREYLVSNLAKIAIHNPLSNYYKMYERQWKKGQ